MDATVLEATTQQGYEEFVQRLAQASGVEPPTQLELPACDRQRQTQTLSNNEWEHPVGPDARVVQRQDGTQDRGHQADHAVDPETLEGTRAAAGGIGGAVDGPRVPHPGG